MQKAAGLDEETAGTHVGWTSFIVILPKLYKFYKYFLNTEIFTPIVPVLFISLIPSRHEQRPRSTRTLQCHLTLKHQYLETW